RPTRPISTIDLDEDIKKALVEDVERYLSPERAQWYANRGIPYRRGYLFHGPPGTGKSSMSLALAGLFNKDLYMLSLSDVESESDLKDLLDTVKQTHSIVLLEDIDSARIGRENMTKKKEEEEEAHKKGGISLSGLLNAIDGPNALDGTVLIMTTNNPETLDKALIRNGRIDMQVYFGPVSQVVAESIFLRMFQKENDKEPNEAVDENIAHLAQQFSLQIPDRSLTPAEVQGFLMTQNTPEQAIE
ncbi:P-loop containing nucleoside triphosphate hydrolase protein, partial [Lindgomyces ingoldianus]